MVRNWSSDIWKWGPRFGAGVKATWRVKFGPRGALSRCVVAARGKRFIDIDHRTLSHSVTGSVTAMVGTLLSRSVRGTTNTGTCFEFKFSCLLTSKSTTCLMGTASHIRRSVFHNQICLSPSGGTLTKTAGPEHPLASTSGGGDGKGSP